MGYVLVDSGVLWSNDGTSALTTLASNTDIWFPAGGTTVTSTPNVNQWNVIDCKGADRLIIQVTSRITAVGAITVCASGNFGGAVYGIPYVEPSGTLIPYAPSVTPDLPIYGTLANDSRYHGSVLFTRPSEDSTSMNYGYKGVARAGMGLIPNQNTQIVVGTGAQFWFEIMDKPSGQSGNQATWDINTGISTISRVWVAISSFMVLTGTLTTTKVEGTIRYLLYKMVYPTDPNDGAARYSGTKVWNPNLLNKMG